MITPRLNSIIQNIGGKTLADIGTDHAYIPIYLLQNGLIDYAIACDIKKGPLDIARSNVEKYNIENIELRLGPGLNPIAENETETVVIAGMGGDMIMHILSENPKKSHSFKEIILQPMNCQKELRMWLVNNRFEIVGEDLSKEGFKVYNLIKVKSGENKHEFTSELSWHLPEYLFSHPLFPMLYDKKKREFTKILNGLKKAENKDFAEIKRLENLLEEMKKI